jgi:hypothetical protein
MPYVTCASCGLTTFSAAYRVETEDCARCGAELPRPSRSSTASRETERPELAVRRRFHEPGRGHVDRLDGEVNIPLDR